MNINMSESFEAARVVAGTLNCICGRKKLIQYNKGRKKRNARSAPPEITSQADELALVSAEAETEVGPTCS